MVELTLEHIQENGMPQDCFVSVRVGDAQKLSRLSAARVFRFPQAADRRFGKIEVFRRIGVCSVDVDPTREGLRDVSIDCVEAGFGSLGLKLAVGGAAVQQKKVEETERAKKTGVKEKNAKEYLAKHSLEVQLSDAMQAVLRERPDNPTEFLAAKLLQRAEGSSGPLKMPPMTAGQQWQKPGANVQGTKLESLGNTANGRPLVAPNLFAPGPRDVAPVCRTQAVPLLPFGEYCKANMGTMGPTAWSKLHAKFPAKSRPEKTFGSYYRENFDPCTTLACQRTSSSRAAKQYTQAAFGKLYGKFPVPKAAQKDFGNGYCRTNMPACCTGSFAGLHTKFPAAKGFKAPAAPAVVLKGSDGKTRAYYVENFKGGGESAFDKLYKGFPGFREPTLRWSAKPSTGTWLMINRNPPPPEKKVEDPKFKPSVGTWIMPVRKEDPDRRAKMMLAAKEAATPVSSGGPQPSFKSAPSVGTWIAPYGNLRVNKCEVNSQSGHGQVAPQMKFRPSVGTWLTHRIEEDEKPATKKPMMPTSMKFGPVFYSMRMRPNVFLL